MKRMWHRHRTWFLAVFPGLALATILWTWFTPRPERVIKLPEVSESRSSNLELNQCDGEWVAIQSKIGGMVPYRVTFANTFSGDTCSWYVPANPENVAYGYALAPNTTDKFRLILVDQMRLQPISLQWFSPDTQAEGNVDIPPFRDSYTDAPDRRMPYDYACSVDGFTMMQARYGEEGQLQFQLLDLETGTSSETITVPGQSPPKTHHFSPPDFEEIKVGLSPDGSRVGFARMIDGETIFEIRNAADGTLIERHTTNPWTKATAPALSLRRVNCGPMFEVVDAEGTVLHQCPDHWALTHLTGCVPPFDDPPFLAPEPNGILCLPRYANLNRSRRNRHCHPHHGHQTQRQRATSKARPQLGMFCSLVRLGSGPPESLPEEATRRRNPWGRSLHHQPEDLPAHQS